MDSRDIFDVLLVILLAIVLFVEGGWQDVAPRDPRAVLVALSNLDTVVYFILAGVLGVVFVIVITVYVPSRQNGSAGR